jgi:hypothetical protein
MGACSKPLPLTVVPTSGVIRTAAFQFSATKRRRPDQHPDRSIAEMTPMKE